MQKPLMRFFSRCCQSLLPLQKRENGQSVSITHCYCTTHCVGGCWVPHREGHVVRECGDTVLAVLARVSIGRAVVCLHSYCPSPDACRIYSQNLEDGVDPGLHIACIIV